MQHLFPRHTATLPVLLDDLGAPSARALGKAFGVSARTVQRWQAADSAPRPVLLALHAASRWGRSDAETRAYNAAALATAQVRCLTAENEALRAEIARLATLACYGSANAPSWKHAARPGLEQQPQQDARRDRGERVPRIGSVGQRSATVIDFFPDSDNERRT